MARSRTQSLAALPSEVFDAAFDAADQLGFRVSLADRAAGNLFLSQSRGQRGRSHPFGVSVTDSGLGRTVVFISWGPHLTPPWRSDARSARRLCRRIRENLGQE